MEETIELSLNRKDLMNLLKGLEPLPYKYCEEFKDFTCIGGSQFGNPCEWLKFGLNKLSLLELSNLYFKTRNHIRW